MPRRVPRGGRAGRVWVVDSDDRSRRSLLSALEAEGLESRGFSSAEDLLENWREAPDCVVTEVELGGIDGLELQRRLVELGSRATIVFLTREADVATAVAALRGGAVEFLEKFLTPEVVARRVKKALQSVSADSATAARG